jgi:hypothetical protein
MAIAVGDDYFDGTSSPERVERHLRVARDIGASYLRCAFTWNAIEKAKGQYDWAFWDRLVEAAESNGIELIPYVAYTPEWAASVKKTSGRSRLPTRNCLRISCTRRRCDIAGAFTPGKSGTSRTIVSTGAARRGSLRGL